MQDNLKIALHYLFIDLAIKTLELDLKHIRSGSFKIKSPYLEKIQTMIYIAIDERRKLKKIMYDQKIQIIFLYKQGNFSTYKFISERNEREITLMNPVIKKNVEKVMKWLMQYQQEDNPPSFSIQ